MTGQQLYVRWAVQMFAQGVHVAAWDDLDFAEKNAWEYIAASVKAIWGEDE